MNEKYVIQQIQVMNDGEMDDVMKTVNQLRQTEHLK
jgi:hypothetical protein